MELAFLGSAFSKLLFNRYTLALLVAVVAFFGLRIWIASIEKAAYDRGHVAGMVQVHAELDPQIKDLREDLAHEQSVVKAYKATVENQQEAFKKAKDQLEKDQAAALASAKAKLDASEEKRKQLEKLYAKARDFISVASDNRCTIPAGFVRLHDTAARADQADPGEPAKVLAVSRSGPPDDDAATTVALSEVGATVAANYTTYHGVADTLTEWQTWYKTTYANWLKAQATQASYQEVLPAAPQ